jgi:hypothetical protein
LKGKVKTAITNALTQKNNTAINAAIVVTSGNKNR